MNYVHILAFACLQLVTATPLFQTTSSGTNWAVLVAGSKGWDNYRHQADVSHAYQVLIKNHFKPENIIVFIFDDIAYNPMNPYPGQIFNEPNGPNVYAGVKIDYRSNTITAETIGNVLRGNATGNRGKGSGKVLQSTAADNVFIYYAAHGNYEILGVPGGGYFDKNYLFSIFEYMYVHKMYKKVLFYLETCYGGTMFSGLSPDWNIFAVSASNEHQESSSTYCSPQFTCLGDHFSVNWMRDSETHNIFSESIGLQVDYATVATTSSNVSQYGNKNIRSDMVGGYQGGSEAAKSCLPVKALKSEAVNIWEASLLTAQITLQRQKLSKVKVAKAMLEFTRKRESLENFIQATVESAAPGAKLSLTPSKTTELPCYYAVISAFDAHCAPLHTNSYAYHLIGIFANLCEITRDPTKILHYFRDQCDNGPLFVDVI